MNREVRACECEAVDEGGQMTRRRGNSWGVEETRSAVVREGGEGDFGGFEDVVRKYFTRRRTMRCCATVATALKLRKNRYWNRIGDVDSHCAGAMEAWSGVCFSMRAQVR